jgi:hypothetical protein
MVLVGAVLATAAIVVISWQFARRRTWSSRLVGLAGVLVAELLLAFLSPMFLARVRAAVNPAGANISFHVRPESLGFFDPNDKIRSYAPPGFLATTVPLSVAGIPEGTQGLFDQYEVLDLIAPHHQQYQLRPLYFGRDGLLLHIRREIFERLKNAKVDLKGSVPVILYRNGPSTSIPVGARGTAPGVGRCSSEVISVRGSLGVANTGYDPLLSTQTNPEHHRFLRVACESPEGSALPAFVNLRQSTHIATSARLDWLSSPGLSPLKRTMASFTLSPNEEPGPSWKLEFSSEMPLGWQIVSLDLRELRVADYTNLPFELPRRIK